MAVSAMLAVLLWLVVIAQEPNKTYTITGVSVSYDYNSALYTGASLDIVKSDDIKVSVVVSGDSSAIGGVDKSDIVVYQMCIRDRYSGGRAFAGPRAQGREPLWKNLSNGAALSRPDAW